MADPLLEGLPGPARVLVRLDDRQVVEEGREVLFGGQPEMAHLVDARAHLHRSPAQIEGQLEGAAGIDPVMVEIGEAHLGRHRREMGIAQRRRHPLSERDVGAPLVPTLPLDQDCVPHQVWRRSRRALR